MITDLETFMIDDGFERIFRMLERREPGDWTPREMAERYSDQGHYVDNHYTPIKIVELIELPNKDVLVGYKVLEDKDTPESEDFEQLPIFYKPLSRLELSFFPSDMEDTESEWGFL